MIFLDKSILVAYDCPEPLSEQADRLLRSQIIPAASDLTEVELIKAPERSSHDFKTQMKSEC